MNDKLTAEFISELFHCAIQHKGVLDICMTHLKENYLPLEEQKQLFREMQSQHRVGFRKVSFGTLLQEFRKNKPVFEYIGELKHLEIDPDNVVDKFESFLKQSRFIEVYDQCYDLYNKGQKNKAYEHLIKSAEDLGKFSLTVEQLEQVFAGFPARNTDRIVKASSGIITKIPFGIPELDDITNGGPELGHLVLFMGDAKAGKSIALIHCGVNAARRGHGVLHVQREGSKAEVLERYDSAWSGSTYYEIKDGNFSEDKFKVYRKIVNNLGKTDIHLFCKEKFNSTTMIETRRILIELKKQYDIKAVIDDYADLANPDDEVYRSSDERFRQQKTIRAQKDLAVEQQVVYYTATQASSIAKELLDDPSYVINRESLSEDKGKVRPVDMLFSINRTADERKSKIARIYVDALRGHDSGQVVTIAQSLGRTRFYNHKRTVDMDLGNIAED